MTSEIYRLSWDDDTFFGKAKLLFSSYKKEKEKINSQNPYTKGEGYSALSSTCFSIANTAKAKLRASFSPWYLVLFKPVICLFTWVPLGAFCFFWMLPLSNKVKKILGYENMSADQCDVRQSILRAWHFYKKALNCARWGLIKEDASAHTIALLHLGISDISLKFKCILTAESHISDALSKIKEAEKESPRQAVRIYKKSAFLYQKIYGHNSIRAKTLLKKAEKLAKETGTKDQLAKIKGG